MVVTTRSRSTIAGPRTPARRRRAPRQCPKETQSIVASAQRTQHADARVLQLEKEVRELKTARALNAQKLKSMERNRARNTHRIEALVTETRTQQRRIETLTQKLAAAKTQRTRRHSELDKKLRNVTKTKFSWLMTCIKWAGLLSIAEFLRQQYYSIPTRQHAAFVQPQRELRPYRGLMNNYSYEELMKW